MPKDRNDLIDFARTSRKVVKWSAGVLIVFFGWLQLRDIPIGEIVGNVSGDLLTKIALSIYYLSWVAGLRNDVDEQEKAYAKSPNQGRFPWKEGILATVAIVGVFAILCVVSSATWFGVVLAVFLAINVAGYIYIRSLIMPTIEESRKEYTKDEDQNSLFKLKIVEAYMTGPWQTYRFVYAFAAIGIVIAMGFSRLPQLLSSVYPSIPPGTYVAISVLLYVITVEGWMWLMRIWTKVARGTVDFIFDTGAQRDNKRNRGIR